MAPEFKFNLLSISKLADIGYTTSFSEDSMTIRDQKNNIIASNWVQETKFILKLPEAKLDLLQMCLISNKLQVQFKPLVLL